MNNETCSFMLALVIIASVIVGSAGKRKLSEAEIQRLLKQRNKFPVKSTKGSEGRIIDCVHVMDQPSMDHPLLKNQTIQMRPSGLPKFCSKKEDAFGKSEAMWNQLWRMNGECPKNTIPITRTTREDLLREASLKKKKLPPLNRSYVVDENRDKHEYAIMGTQGELVGGKARMGVWNPRVEAGANEFSLAQLWLISDPVVTTTVEAGWQVYPGLYGDTKTHLFTFWTDDAYGSTGCYNLGCPGFVHTDHRVTIGGVLPLTSVYDGTQFYLELAISMDPVSKHWWLYMAGEPLGYWHRDVVTGLDQGAQYFDLGGEIDNENPNQHTSTEMGSGHFPDEGLGKAASFFDIAVVDSSDNVRDDLGSFKPTITHGNCYTLYASTFPEGTGFYYGGPGRHDECP
ncbi:PREDICTED: uncharacterized protein LOC104817585 [Tarenaya hassleriana]|uniref:uncharacterized protein LOC104817585 n=1 Tax=Tarenaya hassleriana TaxID=28532 RepID=UPI00053C363E|nr:PREDICTED: uncharacterized protein LOC104817585 [Tarenaya hassleriana]